MRVLINFDAKPSKRAHVSMLFLWIHWISRTLLTLSIRIKLILSVDSGISYKCHIAEERNALLEITETKLCRHNLVI